MFYIIFVIVDELESYCILEGYEKSSSTIKDFWKIIRTLDQQLQAKFIYFFTGKNYNCKFMIKFFVFITLKGSFKIPLQVFINFNKF